MKNQGIIETPKIPNGMRVYGMPRPDVNTLTQEQIFDELEGLNLIRDKTPEEQEYLRELVAARSTGRRSEPSQPSNSAHSPIDGGHHPATGGHLAGASDETGGFQTFGHYAVAIRDANRRGGGSIDPRLVVNAPTTTSREGVGADGGFAVPNQFKTEIWQKVAGEDSLLPRTDQLPAVSNQIIIPADEGAPWASTGPQAYFESEASQLKQSKVALKDKTIRLNKLTSLVPVTEELMEDAPSLDGYLRRVVGSRFHFKLNHKLVSGSGAGEPLGILNSASAISIAKEDGQPADSLVFENFSKMRSALYAGCWRNSIFLAHQTILPKLDSLVYPITEYGTPDAVAVAGHPVYNPDSTSADAPHGRLFGRPILFTEACETLGDKGDIILVDPKQYMTAVKTGGIKTDVSMHLWFDYDVMAYRFILRIAGMPWWAEPITSRDGSTQYSWAVTLDERA
ncbi:major capsid protein, HK97 [Desulfosarcina variabilis str. Montpellier]|uniref:phage major capsid protein n=1 Tax=Desulfosarcina variabilis TaxID=2300 RepID=UPI003AFA05BB